MQTVGIIVLIVMCVGTLRLIFGESTWNIKTALLKFFLLDWLGEFLLMVCLKLFRSFDDIDYDDFD